MGICREFAGSAVTLFLTRDGCGAAVGGSAPGLLKPGDVGLPSGFDGLDATRYNGRPMLHMRLPGKECQESETRESHRLNAQHDLPICYSDIPSFLASPIRPNTSFTSLKNNQWTMNGTSQDQLVILSLTSSRSSHRHQNANPLCCRLGGPVRAYRTRYGRSNIHAAALFFANCQEW